MWWMHFLPLKTFADPTFLIFQIVQYLHPCLPAHCFLLQCLCGHIVTFISALALRTVNQHDVVAGMCILALKDDTMMSFFSTLTMCSSIPLSNNEQKRRDTVHWWGLTPFQEKSSLLGETQSATVSMCCAAFRKLAVFDTWSRLVVHVAMDNTVVIEEISECTCVWVFVSCCHSLA